MQQCLLIHEQQLARLDLDSTRVRRVNPLLLPVSVEIPKYHISCTTQKFLIARMVTFQQLHTHFN